MNCCKPVCGTMIEVPVERIVPVTQTNSTGNFLMAAGVLGVFIYLVKDRRK